MNFELHQAESGSVEWHGESEKHRFIIKPASYDISIFRKTGGNDSVVGRFQSAGLRSAELFCERWALED